MGEVIAFPDTGKKAPERAEEYNRSLPASTEDQANYRREQFRLIEGGKENG